MSARMRSSTDRWTAMGIMVAQLERCMEANARLDAHRPTGIGRPAIDHAATTGAAICARIDALRAKICREMNKLTVERLDLDMASKQMKAAS